MSTLFKICQSRFGRFWSALGEEKAADGLGLGLGLGLWALGSGLGLWARARASFYLPLYC